MEYNGKELLNQMIEDHKIHEEDERTWNLIHSLFLDDPISEQEKDTFINKFQGKLITEEQRDFVIRGRETNINLFNKETFKTIGTSFVAAAIAIPFVVAELNAVHKDAPVLAGTPSIIPFLGFTGIVASIILMIKSIRKRISLGRKIEVSDRIIGNKTKRKSLFLHQNAA